MLLAPRGLPVIMDLPDPLAPLEQTPPLLAPPARLELGPLVQLELIQLLLAQLGLLGLAPLAQLGPLE